MAGMLTSEMRSRFLRRVVMTAAFAVAFGGVAAAQTCADQDKACRARGHTVAECSKSTNECLKTGRWIGPAGNEYPISKPK